MKNIISTAVVLSLSFTVMLTSNTAEALDIRGWNVGIQPRLTGGLMYYEYKQEAFNEITKSFNEFFGTEAPGAEATTIDTQNSFKYKDIMPVINGGATFFIERFFIDLSAQKAFNGSDSDQIRTSRSTQYEDESSSISFLQTANPDYDTDFDRVDYAISIGYGITNQLSVFAGYKWTKTSFNTKGSGTINETATGFSIFEFVTGEIDIEPFFGEFEYAFEQEVDYDFKYDGPFVGLAYGIDVNKNFLKGNVSFNFAAAYLDANVNIKNESSTIIFDPTVREARFEQGRQEFRNTFNSKGNTIGLTFGINWRGFTPLENLTYSFGVNGYKYSFDADDNDPDIEETTVNFNVGIAYAF